MKMNSMELNTPVEAIGYAPEAPYSDYVTGVGSEAVIARPKGPIYAQQPYLLGWFLEGTKEG
jgi:hypothetical protein